VRGATAFSCHSQWVCVIPTPFVYNAWIIEVHDGDTVLCKVDRGNRDYSAWSIRLLGCNAIELADPGGVEARDNLAALLPVGTPVTLYTVKPDKYGGRMDAFVHFLRDGKEEELSSLLISTGWAALYTGLGSKNVPVWPRVI
jgi:endonuclease YncB( thermonuclease family)